MSFQKRRIDVTFQLGEGEFGESGFDTVKLTGLRCIVDIALAGGISKGALNLRVYGMDLPTMNKLARVGRIAPSTRQNIVTVQAGQGDVLPVIYKGSIFAAWVDFSGMPEVCLNVEAAAGWYEAIKPVSPISIKGAGDVALIVQTIADSVGFGFVNQGVNVKVASPYLPGSAWDQLQAITQAADINFSVDRNSIYIWNKGEARLSDLPTISSGTGMVGYPRFNDNGISLSTEFNPSIVFGGQVNVVSELLPAQGAWVVNQLSHNLSSELPNGPWLSHIECSRYDKPAIIPR